jgi:hypothetical protein
MSYRKENQMKHGIVAVLAVALTLGSVSAASAHHYRIKDRLEDRADRLEDIRDRREDRRDARHQGGLWDRVEDVFDRMEDIRDRREDRRDCRRGSC